MQKRLTIKKAKMYEAKSKTESWMNIKGINKKKDKEKQKWKKYKIKKQGDLYQENICANK